MNFFKKNLSEFILIIIISVFNLFILIFPEEILSASRNGIILWAKNVVPSLLPFIIGTNILKNTGVIEIIGFFLEDFMYPIFKVPGCGAFALISGMISGYPLGAKITTDLYESKQISEIQAQRLISFCNNSGPLFILGTVGTVMLKNKNAGYFIMLVHYLSAILTGFIFRNYKSHSEKYFSNNNLNIKKSKIFFRVIKKISSRDKKNIGRIITDSVSDGIQAILKVGGFILLFSIAAKILELSNLITIIWNFISKINFIYLLGYKNFYGILIGLIEVTNGVKIITEQNSISMISLIILSALISFGGFCVHLQSLSFISKSKIKTGFYIFAKAIQASISILLSFIFLNLFNLNFNSKAVEAFSSFNKNFTSRVIFSVENIIFILLIELILAILIFIIRCICKLHKKIYNK